MRPVSDDGLSEAWELAGKAGKNRLNISPEKTEDELSKLWARIDASDNEETNTRPSAGDSVAGELPVADVRQQARKDHAGIRVWHWAAAAMVLIAVAFVYQFQSRTIRYVAPMGEISKVELPDGSRVTLNAGSEISYSKGEFASSDRTITLKGEAFFDVTTTGQPFSVQTSIGSVDVLGTEFNVNAWPDDSRVYVAVQEGRVAVIPKRGEDRQILNAGDAAWMTGDTSERETATNIDHSFSWQSGDLAFVEQSLSSVFSEIGRRFDIKVDYPAGLALDSGITAYYGSPEEAEPIISDICRVKGLRYRATNNGFQILEK